jgi:hypothetical protein
MNQEGNLYTFGCSLTCYSWPTWADILGKEFAQHENWGRGSAGNLYIFESVIECLLKNNIGPNDTIVILWSAITRMDYYQLGTWASMHHRSMLDTTTDLVVNCPDGNEIISYSYFAAVDKLLSLLDVKYYMFKWCQYDYDTKAGTLYNSTLSRIQPLNFNVKPKKIIKPAEYQIKEVYDRLHGSDWPAYECIFSYDQSEYPKHINEEIDNKFFKYLNDNRRLFFDETTQDNHPLPCEHLTAIEKYFDISESTKIWVNEINDLLVRGLPFNFTKIKPERL